MNLHSTAMALLGALLSLSGCPRTDPADDDAADDDDLAGVEIVVTHPAEGATDLFYRDSIWVEFSDVPIEASIELRSDDGDEVPGTLSCSKDQRRLIFDPHGDSELDQLQTTTAYTATITYAGHPDAELHFETSAACAPLGWNSDDPVGADFHVDLMGAHILDPPGLDSILAQYISGLDVVLHVASLDDDTHEAELVLGLVDGNASHYLQVPCVATIQVTEGAPALWDDAYLAFGAAEFVYDDGLFATTVHDLHVSGCLTMQGDMITLGKLEGTLDLRDFDELLEPVGEGGEICEVFDSLGIPCEPCPDGSGPFCHRLEVTNLAAEPVNVTATDPETLEETDHLVPVTTDQVAQWEAAGICADGGSGCGACEIAAGRHRGPFAVALISMVGLALVWRRSSER